MDFLDNPRIRRPAAALLTAFSTAAAAGPSAPDDETLWKTQTLDTVVALKPCKETGMCGSIYWVNPDDSKIYSYFGDPKTRRNSPFGDDSGPTRDDVKALCGFSPKMNFTEAASGHWQGRMEMRGMGMTVNVDAAPVSEREMRVTTSKGIFRQTETWVRVDRDDPRYPKCSKP